MHATGAAWWLFRGTPVAWPAVIDVRAIREDREAVAAALARRGVPRPRSTRSRSWTSSPGTSSPPERPSAAQVKELSRLFREASRSAEPGVVAALREESRALGDRERAAAQAADDAQTVAAPGAAGAAQPAGRGGPRRRRARGQRRVSPVVAGHGRRVRPQPEYGPHQQGAALGGRRAELGLLDMERGARLSGSMFPLFRRTGARAAAGAERVRARPPRRRVRGDPPAHAGAHRDDDRDRPPAEASPTRRTTSNATTCGRSRRPRCRSPRCTAARSSTRPTCPLRFTRGHRVLSAARPGPPGGTPAGCCGCTSSTRSSCSRTPPPSRRRRCTPTSSSAAEGLLRELGLSYRVLDLCAGDLGGSSARTFDLEVYLPGVDRWLEVSSVSWYRDYQARRANVRYRPTGGGPPVLVHTAQRLGARLVADLGGARRDRTPAGRLGAPARVPRPLPRRRDGRSGRLRHAGSAWDSTKR